VANTAPHYRIEVRAEGPGPPDAVPTSRSTAGGSRRAGPRWWRWGGGRDMEPVTRQDPEGTGRRAVRR
jgi:hypothetical protein